MRQTLITLCSAWMFISAAPAKHANVIQAIGEASKPFSLVVHSFHYQTEGSDLNTYYITIDFNLSTQQFGVISAHNISAPTTEYTATRLAGAGDTTGGNGSTIEIFPALSLRITVGGSFVYLYVPVGTYTFDY